MTDKQFSTLFFGALADQDRDMYVSDWALSDIWGDPEGADIPDDRIQSLGALWDDPRDQSSHWLVSGCFCPALLHPSPDSGELGIWGKHLSGLSADFVGSSRRAVYAGLNI